MTTANNSLSNTQALNYNIYIAENDEITPTCELEETNSAQEMTTQELNLYLAHIQAQQSTNYIAMANLELKIIELTGRFS